MNKNSDDTNHIVIFATTHFPFGSAGAARVRHIAKAFNVKGSRVRVVTTFRIDPAYINEGGENVWDDIRFESVKDYSNDYPRIVRFFLHIISLFKMFIRLVSLDRESQCDAVYVYGRSFISFFLITMYALLNRINIIFDICEWFPVSRFKRGMLNLSFLDDYFGRLLSFFGGVKVVAISHFVKNKYKKKIDSVALIPSIIDSEMFMLENMCERKKVDEELKTVYVGSFKNGDDSHLLFDAVKLAIRNGCPVRLFIIGGRKCNLDDCSRFDEDYIVFLGRLSEEEYIEHLNSADCLLLPREDSQITKAALPNRIPEFLMTENPVITSNVGDVSLYLTDMVDSLLVESGDVDGFAKALRFIWENPKEAAEIGRRGALRCREVFDYSVYAESLVSLIT